MPISPVHLSAPSVDSTNKDCGCVRYDKPRVFIVGRKPSRMRGLGDFAGLDFLEGVEALAGGGHGIHEMHAVSEVSDRL